MDVILDILIVTEVIGMIVVIDTTEVIGMTEVEDMREVGAIISTGTQEMIKEDDPCRLS